jgi:flagellar M-ring protein FliF
MDLTNFYSSLTTAARMRLLAGVALVAVLTAALLWWVMTPRQQLLFGNLREGDAAEIVASLTEWKVPHEITDGGASITVPADRVYETRMRLVSAGVPRGGHVGFELFDDADFGVTEFAQRVNYQRALQGEIERTIAALPGVETARVHLTIRRPGLFVGEHETSKASVALTLRPGETLTRPQVGGIRSLVAAAVEGLAPDAVAVLDSNGALLAGNVAAASGVGLDERQSEKAKLEAQLQTRIVDLLGQVLSREEFHVSVDATLNFDAVREVSERPLTQLDGSSVLVRKHVNSSGGGEREGLSQNQEDSEYAHGTTRAEISRAPGRVERLSVAVILPPTLDENEVVRIQSLVAAAAGIDVERGDRLEVSRLGRDQRWTSSAREPAPAASAESDWSVDTAAIGKAKAAPAWTKFALIALAGLLVGVIAAIASQRRPRVLKEAERDAVLAKLKGWLAEGSM